MLLHHNLFNFYTILKLYTMVGIEDFLIPNPIRTELVTCIFMPLA